MARLVIREGTSERTVEIGQEPLLIGRAASCTVSLNDPKCSRQHCQIDRTPAGYKLVDLESRNGTLVNGQIVNQHLLRPGDRIQIGDVTIEFDDHNLLPSEPSPPAAPAPAPLRRPPSQVRPPTELRGPSVQALLARRRSSQTATALAVFAAVGAAALVGWVIYSSLKPSSQRQEWQEQLRLARELLPADPARAREIARAIPPQAGDLYASAQDLIRRIDREQHQAQSQTTGAMISEFVEIQNLAYRSNRYEEILRRADEFGRRWAGQMTPEMHDELRRIRSGAHQALQQQLEVDLERLRQDVQQALHREPPRFTDAAGHYERLRPAFAASPTTLQRAEQIRQEILSRAEQYFTQHDTRAVELLQRDADAAARIYEQMLLAFGRDPAHPDFGLKVQIIQGRLQQIHQSTPPSHAPEPP